MAVFGACMSRELVVCIRVAVYDKIQTAHSIDVAQFLPITASFSENHFRERRKSVKMPVRSRVRVSVANGQFSAVIEKQ
jgi:hypothetical protein